VAAHLTYVRPATSPRWEEGRERGDGACSHPREEELRSDRGTILRETVEAYADLHTILDGLTEEQASRIRLGVLGVRDLARDAS
jgi:hypothetical protein